MQSVNAKAGANTVPILTTVKYGYTLGRTSSITYPSGSQLTMTRTGRRVSALSLSAVAGGTPVPLISHVKWEPFGPVSGWDWHMASGLVTHLRQFDLSGRIVRYPLGNALRDVSYDVADRITGFTHLNSGDGTAQPALDQSFGYDNAGNTTSDSAGYTATYGLNGSIASITKAGVTGSCDYDAERRRIRKVTSTGETVIFVYDLEGQLLGEYDQTGKALREYAWLDNIPVAMFMPDPANASSPPLIFYIHADHLNAPRIVVDQNGAKRWRWLAEPFGTTAPETNPDGLGSFTQNLRFPGQYADAESGLWYNYFRYYDKDGGRYAQSDPIGLAGGINTYAYVSSDALQFIDPTGLERIVLKSPEYGSLDLFDQIPEEPGVIDVIAHGNWHEVTENQKIVNEKQLADMIRKRFPNYKKMKVCLFACNTGSDSYRGVKVVPFARNLYRVLGVPVVAPNRSIWAASDGTYSVYGHKGMDIHGPKNPADRGAMVEFKD